MDGIINVYKEKGYTSFDVVAKLRGILKTKKIGHTGTLDPDAEGVLPVCVGSATKLCDMLTDKSKEYTAVMRLGITTDTQDMTGNVTATGQVPEDEALIRRAACSFIGEYDQIPPMYSALKVGGQKLCDLARQGKVVERAARRVTVHELTVTEVTPPLVTMHVHCSKGTYIRTLCQDIGEKLGCGGCMQSLVRTRVSEFVLEDAKTLLQIERFRDEGRLAELILPVDSVFFELEPVRVNRSAQRLLDNGNPVRLAQTDAGMPEPMAEPDRNSITYDGNRAGGTGSTQKTECARRIKVADGTQVRMYHSDGRFCGVYAYRSQNHTFQPVKIFFL
ncbi:MAG: tRNA pseudouridine(55) synthase TruB [Clostridium sp.]|nr:tRNA pseudouridine(55) synthase TruB [Clostridium sp.]